MAHSLDKERLVPRCDGSEPTIDEGGAMAHSLDNGSLSALSWGLFYLMLGASRVSEQKSITPFKKKTVIRSVIRSISVSYETFSQYSITHKKYSSQKMFLQALP